MKTYQSVKKERKLNRTINILFLFIVLLMFFYFGFFTRSSSVAQIAAQSFWRAQSNVSVNLSMNIDVWSLSKRHLVANIEGLIEELNSLRAQRDKLLLLENENILLKETLNRSRESSLTLANILTKPNKSLYKTFVIDIGSQDGVSDGDEVVAYGNLFVGTLDDVFDKTSNVLLSSSPDNLRQMVFEPTGLYVDTRGLGGNAFEFILPRDMDVEVGDTLLHPGFEGYISGIVEEVVFDPRDPSKRVLARLPVNIHEIRWLEVSVN